MADKIGIFFKIFGYCLFLTIIAICMYAIFNPQYFHAVEGIDSNRMNYYIIDENIKEPILDCENYSYFEEKEYDNVELVKIYWKKCAMYNLPENEPYIKNKNKFIWFITKYQLFIIIFLFVPLYLLKHLYDKKKYKNSK